MCMWRRWCSINKFRSKNSKNKFTSSRSYVKFQKRKQKLREWFIGVYTHTENLDDAKGLYRQFPNWHPVGDRLNSSVELWYVLRVDFDTAHTHTHTLSLPLCTDVSKTCLYVHKFVSKFFVELRHKLFLCLGTVCILIKKQSLNVFVDGRTIFFSPFFLEQQMDIEGTFNISYI